MALPFLEYQPGMRLQPALDGGEEHLLLLVLGLLEEGNVALLGAHAEVDQHGGVAAVVEHHVRRAAVGPLEDLVGVLPIVRQVLALDGEDRRAGGGDRGGGVVLRRVDVARGPAHVGAERLERLDQHAGLDRHVQRAGDARALERLRRPIFRPGRHQARHLGLGDVELLAPPGGELDVGDDVIVGGVLGGMGHEGDPVRGAGLVPKGARQGNKDMYKSLCRYFDGGVARLWSYRGGVEPGLRAATACAAHAKPKARLGCRRGVCCTSRLYD